MRQDILLKKYPVRLRYSTIFVVIGLALLTYLFPRFIDEKMQLTHADKKDIIELTDIPATVQEKIIIPPSKPTIPVIDPAVEFEDDDITTIPVNDFLFKKWDRPPPAKTTDFFPVVLYSKAPILITPIRPVYPPDAIHLGIEGTVKLAVFINKSGIIEYIKIISSAHLLLDEAAVDAVRNTRWKPAQQQDRKIGVTLEFPIEFKLQ
jgi:periplasmic protein TonB